MTSRSETLADVGKWWGRLFIYTLVQRESLREQLDRLVDSQHLGRIFFVQNINPYTP